MATTDHPEYPTEQEHLTQALAVVDTKVKDIPSLSWPEEVWWRDDGAEVVREKMAMQRAYYESLKQQITAMQVSPYFGRVDFAQLGNTDAETFYLGEYALTENGTNILSWRAPIAALFYRAASHRVKYESPSGIIHGHLNLKRRFMIQNRAIMEVRDEWDTRSQREMNDTATTAIEQTANIAIPSMQDPDAFLRSVLSGQASTKLKQIVASIQSEQYALIEAKPEQALIVQGVAGSGKTSVALHRLSYLLYPGNAQDLRPGRCVIFGPNRLFLNYTAAILSRLDIAQINQMTPAGWACNRLTAVLHANNKEHKRFRPKHDPPPAQLHLSDMTLNALLAPDTARERKRELYLSSQYKTSRRMAELLDRYISFLRTQVAIPSEGWTFEDVGRHYLELHLTHNQILAALKQHMALPLVQQRQEFINTCHDVLLKEYDSAFAGDFPAHFDLDHELERQRIRDSLLDRIERRVYRAWPPFDPVAAYISLITDRSLVERLSRNVFKAQELDLLLCASPTPNARMDIDESDLPAIHYLQCSVDPPTTEYFDHVVIDEAQDVSELEYLTLQRFFMRHNSCTILGDLPQSIYSHRGITSWKQVQALFPSDDYIFGELRRSYRTTYQITELADSILRVLGEKRKGMPRAEPFDRYGAPVRMQQATSDNQLIDYVKRAVEYALNAGHRNIAIIPKTVGRCQDLAPLLKHQLPHSIAIVDNVDFDYQGGIVIIPIHLAKGVEFDVAIVIDADEYTYSDTEFDGRLLYVAVTRAMHQLYIFWQGQWSPYLQHAEGIPL